MNSVTITTDHEDDPYASPMRAFMARQFPNTFQTSKGEMLDILTDAIVASGQTRYGPKPSPESLVEIRKVITLWTARQKPIPFLVPWGSEKPDGTGVDVAELSAIKTMSCLNNRVTQFYQPGVVFNVRLEDVSAPHLFMDRMEQARAEAALYTSGFVNLIGIMEKFFINPQPESAKITEAEFNEVADKALPSVERALKHQQTTMDEVTLSYFGFTVPNAETVGYYLNLYRGLYPERTAQDHLTILARYFAGALARKYLKLSGASKDWESDFLELSFLPPTPGLPENRALKRLHYRTMPSNITSSHIAPWRAKGYLKITDDQIGSSVASFREARQYNKSVMTFERDGRKQAVQADYVLEN